MDSSTLCPGGDPISLGIAGLSKFAFSEGAAYYALDNYLKQEKQVKNRVAQKESLRCPRKLTHIILFGLTSDFAPF